MEKLIDGVPTIIVENGKALRQRMHRARKLRKVLGYTELREDTDRLEHLADLTSQPVAVAGVPAVRLETAHRRQGR